ncbi:MAG: hypothetical protein IKH54_03105 [Bacilli bacterium]|nr:hypothetical protein [Bacilli bacterium]
MYEAPKKVSGKKLIEICVLLFLIFWGVILLINYRRYCDTKKPILMIHLKNEYDDGYTDNYVGLFYNIRYYRRNSITKDEMVPFWKGMENPEPTPDLPVPEKGYPIPENPRSLDKFRGLLWYYDENGELIATYKCINGNSTCNKATGGWDKYNVIGNDPLRQEKKYYRFKDIHNKYAWIDDSFEQTNVKYGDPTYNRLIYLFKIDKNDPEILAKYADIKESTYDEYYELADGYKENYIVKDIDSGKWGIVHIKKDGTIEEVLPFEYDSVSFDADTLFYILAQDDKWMIKDITNDKVIAENITAPVYDVWMTGNQSYYYMTGVSRMVAGTEQIMFKAYRDKGTPLLDAEGITAIFPFPRCIMYVDSSDNLLKFMGYDKEVKYTLQLNFSIMKHDDVVHPAVAIESYDNERVRVKIYRSHSQSNEYDFESVNIANPSKN